MKKILSLVILCCFCLYANISSLNAQEESYNIAQNKIEEARLLENYIKRYVVRIRSMESQYPSIDSSYIEQVLEDIERVLVVLDNVQKGIYTVNETQNLIDGVISYMKQLNTEIQSKIFNVQIKEREEIERQKRQYLDTVSKIYILTEKIIDIYSRHYLGLLILDQRDRDTIDIIISLREKNKLLLVFETQRFQSVEQMKNYLKNTISSIRNDIRVLQYQRNR